MLLCSRSDCRALSLGFSLLAHLSPIGGSPPSFYGSSFTVAHAVARSYPRPPLPPRPWPTALGSSQFPRETQSFAAKGDGPGASVVFYFRISEGTLGELRGPAAVRSNALKLLSEWCRCAPDDPVMR